MPAFSSSAQTVIVTNSNLAVTINGNPVFGMTVSPGPAVGAMAATGIDALDELRSGGILFYRIPITPTWKATSNTLSQSMITTNQAALDWCAAHGVYDLLILNDLSYFTATDTNTPNLLKSVLTMWQNHPGLGMYKNKDEAWWGKVSEPDLQRGYDIIRVQDPNHLVEQTHAPRGMVSDLQPYNNAASILMVDNYPVVTNGTVASNPPITNTNVSQFGDWTAELSQVAAGSRNFWMVEQIAFSGTVPPNHTLIFPTFQQERFMAYQAIVNGARGLMFFGGNIAATLTNALDYQLGWNWSFWTNTLKPLTLQLTTNTPLSDALVAPDTPYTVSMSGTTYPDIEYLVRESGTNLYLIATKREGSTVNVTFSGLPAWVTNGAVLFESNRTVAVSNGQFTDSFAQWDVHAYKFSSTVSSPVFDLIPASRTNAVYSTTTFTATALGQGPLTFAWRKNGVYLNDGGNISGSHSSQLTVTNLSLADQGSYDVVATGQGSATSAPPAVLTVVDPTPPIIDVQPQSRTDVIRTMATFNVSASGSGTLAYQWQKNGVNLSDGSSISGAVSSSLSLLSVSASDAGTYTVSVSGPISAVTSAPVTLTVISYDTNQLYCYEPFVYTNVGGPVSSNTPNQWGFCCGGPDDSMVAPGSLTYSGWPSSLGNSFTNGGLGQGVRRVWGTNISSGVLYLSALYRVNDLGFGSWNGVATQVGSLQDSTNNIHYQIQIRSNSPTGYVIGLQKNGTGSTAVFDTTEYHAGDTILFVGKYEFSGSNDVASLWINPSATTFGATTNPTTGFLTRNDGTSGPSFDRFNMRQNTTNSLPASQQWDELRFGKTWASVTANPPAITTQPKDATSATGQTVSFSVVATSGLAISYQWKFNGTNLSGKTTSSLTLSNVQLTNGGSYSVVLTNNAGAITSSSVMLSVFVPPSITGQPQNQTIVQGGSGTLTVTAQGTALSYQWYLNNAPLDDAASAAYAVWDADATDAGSYSVVVSNAVGSVTSATAQLTVLFPPQITSSPQSQTILQGNTAALAVAAQGTAPLAYQWSLNNAVVAGVSGSSYTIAKTQPSDVGTYTIVITNSAGSATSAAATLTVVPSSTRLLSISVASNATVNTTWKTETGSNYTFQYKNSLTDTQWTSLSNVSAIAATTSLSDDGGTNAQRFYQLSSAARASDVGGFLQVGLLGNSDSYVAQAFVRPAAAVTLVGSVSANVITVSDTPNWAANQFVYAAGSQSNTYYVRFISGAAEGRAYPITANTGNSLALNLNGDSLAAVQPNDAFTVEPYWTLGTTFPNGQGIFASPTPGNRYTEILLPSTNSGVNLSASAVYFFNAGIWKQVGLSSTSQNDLVLPLNSQFIVRHNVSTNSTMISAGLVAGSKLAIPLRASASTVQDNYVGLARPLAVSLNDSGLISSGAFNPSALPGSRTDELLYFDNSVASRNKSATAIYYYWNSGWRQVGAGTADVGSATVFGAGTTAIIRKGTNTSSSVVWTNSPNW